MVRGGVKPDLLSEVVPYVALYTVVASDGSIEIMYLEIDELV